MDDHDIELPISDLGDALVDGVSLSRQGLQRIASPVSPEAPSPAGSLGSTPAQTPRRNTKSNLTGQTHPISIAGFNEEQFRTILDLVGYSQPNTRVKIEKPPTYDGELSELRSFIAQCTLYFEVTNTINDQSRITYTKSLLRKAASKRITPYVEGRRTATWTTWLEFVEALKTQFRDTDIENKARGKLETMSQGNQPVTNHWHQFRLIATETNCNDQTLQRLLLKSFNKKIHDSWAQVDLDMRSTEELANWAVKKKNKLSYIQTMQASHLPRNYIDQSNPNSNGTFRPNPTPNEPRGDPMDLDTSTKKRYLNLSKQEYERRKKEILCFKYGRRGHSMGKCFLNQRRGRGQPRIREVEDETVPETLEETRNEKSPQ